MIIYAGQPNNFLPKLVKDLQKEMFAKNKQVSEFNIEFFKKKSFSTVYSFNLQKFYSLPEMLNEFISFEGARIDLANYIDKKTELVTGIMYLDVLVKHSDDLLFTFISNPIDRVYDMFYFVKAILANQTALRVGRDIVEYFIPNFSALSLHDFIDYFLEKQGQFSSMDGSVSMCSNFLTQPKLLYKADFIGVKEKLESSIIQLNNMLDIHLDPNQYSKFNTTTSDQYRRKDIEKLLENDLIAYNSIFLQI